MMGVSYFSQFASCRRLLQCIAKKFSLALGLGDGNEIVNGARLAEFRIVVPALERNCRTP